MAPALYRPGCGRSDAPATSPDDRRWQAPEVRPPLRPRRSWPACAPPRAYRPPRAGRPRPRPAPTHADQDRPPERPSSVLDAPSSSGRHLVTCVTRCLPARPARNPTTAAAQAGTQDATITRMSPAGCGTVRTPRCRRNRTREQQDSARPAAAPGPRDSRVAAGDRQQGPVGRFEPGRAHWVAVSPPSRVRVWPVTNDDASEQKNRMAPTRSSGSAIRPNGMRATSRSWNS
jgi:hypothetical protein